MRNWLVGLLLSLAALCSFNAHAAKYETWTQITDEMQSILNESDEIYKTGANRKAIDTVNVAYFQYYEKLGVERNVKTYISGNAASDAEYQFAIIKKLMVAQEDQAKVSEAIAVLCGMLKDQGSLLDGKNSEDEESSSFWTYFIASLFIILREGIEAMIIVAAILAYLVKLGHREKQKPIIQGALLAVVASFGMAWIINALAGANGQNQEITEGVTMLVAVVVLFYVSNFMMAKADAAAWMGYLKGKLSSSLAKGSLYALTFTAFLAVFREGAEVILFYQALLIGAKQVSAVWAGFGAGCVLLIFVYIAIRVLSLRLPLKVFFVGTSVLMYVICIDFVGAAVKEFQEGDLVSVTPVPYVPTVDILGIYPTVETLVPQLIMLALCVFTMIVAVGKWKKARAELEAQAKASPDGSVRINI